MWTWERGRKQGVYRVSGNQEADYNQAKGAAKRAIFKAKNNEMRKFFEDMEREDEKGNVVFRVAKRLFNKNRDTVGASCVKGSGRKIEVEEDKLLEVWRKLFFFNTIFVSSHMYPENPEGTQVIVDLMNIGYISDTARNRTHNLFCPKRESILLGHSDGHYDGIPNEEFTWDRNIEQRSEISDIENQVSKRCKNLLVATL